MGDYIEHYPALADQVVRFFGIIQKPLILVDATAGSGAHAEYMLKHLPIKKLILIDIDPDAVFHLEDKFGDDPRIEVIHGNFANLDMYVTRRGLEGVDGVLFDFGASYHHFFNPQRGFSFAHESKLDMRFDRSSPGPTAWDVVNLYSRWELKEIFEKYGEFPPHVAERIANHIADERSRFGDINTTTQLAEIVSQVLSPRGKIHPATRVFQAIRIEVNKELENIEKGLDSALKSLLPGGIVQAIAYHSLEDRIVKRKFKEWEKEGLGRRLTKKVVKPSWEDAKRHPTVRSARLRVFQKGVNE